MFIVVQFLREEPFKDFATLDHCLEPDLNFLKKANLIIHVLLLDTSFLYQLVYGILILFISSFFAPIAIKY